MSEHGYEPMDSPNLRKIGAHFADIPEIVGVTSLKPSPKASKPQLHGETALTIQRRSHMGMARDIDDLQSSLVKGGHMLFRR